MKLVVFGATGRTGKLIVAEAAKAGHEVTAFVRRPQTGSTQPAVHEVVGNSENYEDVYRAIIGQDACLSALGARDLKTDDLLTNSMRNILRAMDSSAVSRLVVLGAAGALHNAGANQSALRRLSFYIIRSTFLRHPFQDSAAQQQLIENSTTAYTVVCPPRLTDEAGRGVWREDMAALPPRGLTIARQDVAAFMLHVLEDPAYFRRSPHVSW